MGRFLRRSIADAIAYERLSIESAATGFEMHAEGINQETGVSRVRPVVSTHVDPTD
jgi:hypothetical protein